MIVRFIPIIFLGLATLVAVWTIGTSSSFEVCVNNQQVTTKEQSSKNAPKVVFSYVGVRWHCGLHVVYGYRDAVTAIATVFIAFFTCTLWLATSGMFKETKRTADAAFAAVSSERAWVSLERIDVVHAHKGRIDGVPVEHGIGARTVWKNSGRSPAIGMRMHSDHRVIPADQAEAPIFQSDWEQAGPAAPPLGPGHFTHSPPRVVGDEDRAAIYERRLVLIVYCIVQYKDMFHPDIWRTSEVCHRIRFNGMMQERDMPPVPAWDILAFGPQNTAT